MFAVKYAHKIADNHNFQSFILFTIMITAISIGAETVSGLADYYDQLFSIIYYITQTIFLTEIIIRLTAHTPNFRGFYKSFWNTFDFTVVVLSLFPVIGSFTLLARLLRVLRVLRIFSVSKKMRIFCERLKNIFEEVIFLSLIIVIFLYIYSVAGYYLFAKTDPANWGSLGTAILSTFYLLLFQDIPKYINAVISASPLYIIFFVSLYFIFITLLISTIYAVVNKENEVKRG